MPASKSLWSGMDQAARQRACLAGRKAGHSAAQTAAKFGTTRNAVIGVLKRLKDSGVPVPAPRHGHGNKKVAAPKTPTTAQAKQPAKPKSTVNSAAILSELRSRIDAMHEHHPVITRENAFDPIPGTTPMHILDVVNGHCRWATASEQRRNRREARA